MKPSDPTETASPSWAHHVTLRTSDERPFASTPSDLHRTARMLLRHGRTRGIVAFRVVDTHLHALVVAPRGDAGRFAHAVGAALSQTSPIEVHFRMSRVVPVRDPHHLTNAARYLLRQEQHHRLDFDPLHEGSSLPDVIGIRVFDRALARGARLALPRINRADWLAWGGWQGLDQAPLCLGALGAAAAAAVARPDLTGEGRLRTAAVRAAAQVGRAAGLSLHRIGELLEISHRTVREALVAPADPTVARAVEGQLRLRSLLAARTASAAASSGLPLGTRASAPRRASPAQV